ncbi:MAG: TonB-dependent receptor, partial [Usitatibacteraceae bacterium]
ATVDRFVQPAQGRIPAILTQRIPAENREAIAEKVNTAELGYRMKLSTSLSFDVAAFHSTYSDLETSELGKTRLVLAQPAPYVVQTITNSHKLSARSRGLELSAEYQVTPWWRLQPSYSYLKVKALPGTTDPANIASAAILESTDPHHQVSIRSSMTFNQRRQFDIFLRYVSELRGSGPSEVRIPAYTELDVRYAWRLSNGLALSVGGQNLLKRRHAEFTPDLLPSEAVDIERSFYFKAKWQY